MEEMRDYAVSKTILNYISGKSQQYVEVLWRSLRDS